MKFFGAFVMKGSTTAIAMEFCEGRSLEKVYKMILMRQGKTNEKVLGKIACGVLGGLTYLHEKRIIHRGIHPPLFFARERLIDEMLNRATFY